MARLPPGATVARTAQPAHTTAIAPMRVSRSALSEANSSRPHLPTVSRSARAAVPRLSAPRQQPSPAPTGPTDDVCSAPQPTHSLARDFARWATAGAAAGLALAPLAATAAEAAPEGFFDLLIHTIDSLGPLGPVAFIAAVALCECIPLFPTQPFSLASGLLFGTQKGALCMLSGSTLAALIAFTVARGVGRPLAERIIRHEMAAEGNANANASSTNPVQAKLQEVQAVIEAGTFWQQAGAVFVLRMTPIVPFSASNYILGLSPIPLAPYVAGSVAGMSFWATLYASLGGASRALLRRGADPDALLNDLIAKTTSLTEEAGVLAAVLGGAAAAAWGFKALASRAEGSAGEGSLATRLTAAVRSLRQRELASKE